MEYGNCTETKKIHDFSQVSGPTTIKYCPIFFAAQSAK
jgi:hypothetical protein